MLLAPCVYGTALWTQAEHNAWVEWRSTQFNNTRPDQQESHRDLVCDAAETAGSELQTPLDDKCDLLTQLVSGDMADWPKETIEYGSEDYWY